MRTRWYHRQNYVVLKKWQKWLKKMHTIMNTHIQKHLKKECVSIYSEVHSKLELQVGRFGHWSKIESTYLTCFHILLKWWSWQTFGAIQKMVFCYQNCSDPLWEKIVLVIEKNFWNSRLKAEKFQKFWDH